MFLCYLSSWCLEISLFGSRVEQTGTGLSSINCHNFDSWRACLRHIYVLCFMCQVPEHMHILFAIIIWSILAPIFLRKNANNKERYLEDVL